VYHHLLMTVLEVMMVLEVVVMVLVMVLLVLTSVYVTNVVMIHHLLVKMKLLLCVMNLVLDNVWIYLHVMLITFSTKLPENAIMLVNAMRTLCK
jgi:hypothetical protein